MNGIHDLGGRHGMGPLEVDPNEPVFRSNWERSAFALYVLTAAKGHYNVDLWRYRIELMPAASYLETEYYEHWMFALESLGSELGFFSKLEIDERMRTISGDVN